jgi:hypothetical protein
MPRWVARRIRILMATAAVVHPGELDLAEHRIAEVEGHNLSGLVAMESRPVRANDSVLMGQECPFSPLESSAPGEEVVRYR